MMDTMITLTMPPLMLYKITTTSAWKEHMVEVSLVMPTSIHNLWHSLSDSWWTAYGYRRGIRGRHEWLPIWLTVTIATNISTICWAISIHISDIQAHTSIFVWSSSCIYLFIKYHIQYLAIQYTFNTSKFLK